MFSRFAAPRLAILQLRHICLLQLQVVIIKPLTLSESNAVTKMPR